MASSRRSTARMSGPTSRSSSPTPRRRRNVAEALSFARKLPDMFAMPERGAQNRDEENRVASAMQIEPDLPNVERFARALDLLVPAGTPIGLAVSGGPDSLAL